MNCSVKGWFAKFDYLFLFYITYNVYLYIYLFFMKALWACSPWELKSLRLTSSS